MCISALLTMNHTIWIYKNNFEFRAQNNTCLVSYLIKDDWVCDPVIKQSKVVISDKNEKN